MIFMLLVFVVTCFLVRRECICAYQIAVAMTQWTTSRGRVITSSRVLRPWHARKPYSQPRYIAAAQIKDPQGRLIVVKRLTLTNKLHSACRMWVSEHRAGDRVTISHPPGRPDLGILLPVGALWFQMAWRILYVLVVCVASILLTL